ncbi:MAG: hypothetical protein U1F36_10795 [Planctomycetota bacterium]
MTTLMRRALIAFLLITALQSALVAQGCGSCIGTQQPGGGGVTWTFTSSLGQNNATPGTCYNNCSSQSCRFAGTMTVANASGVTIDVFDPNSKKVIGGLANGATNNFAIDTKPGCGDVDGSVCKAMDSNSGGLVSDLKLGCTACVN